VGVCFCLNSLGFDGILWERFIMYFNILLVMMEVLGVIFGIVFALLFLAALIFLGALSIHVSVMILNKFLKKKKVSPSYKLSLKVVLAQILSFLVFFIFCGLGFLGSVSQVFSVIGVILGVLYVPVLVFLFIFYIKKFFSLPWGTTFGLLLIHFIICFLFLQLFVLLGYFMLMAGVGISLLGQIPFGA
jgi:hypothetical protein